jgi:Zn-dependent protease/CBS domain-containing protein
MFGNRITLFKLFGFEVKLDWSWIVIAVLVAWSLAEGFFPHYYQGFSTYTYWLMGILGALGLFASIVFHEFFHSLIARKHGLPMRGITLFIFGGVAEMAESPPSPKVEFSLAIAGPLSSIFLGVFLYTIYFLGKLIGWPTPINAVFSYLALINLVLAFFNLIPAFPLDGGRLLRSALWGWKKDLRWATRIASNAGMGFGILMMGLGIINILIGNFIGGMWWFLIGMFLRNSAATSYQQLLMKQMLSGESVYNFMNPNPISVPPYISLNQLVEDYIYKYHFKMFPVVESDKLIGCISISQIKQIPRERWREVTVGELAESYTSENTISPQADALKALSLMNRTGKTRLMVVENDRLVGVIALKDLLKFFSLKLDLEGLEKPE